MSNTRAAFLAVNEALHRLEAPYYRACAGGAYFDATPAWWRQRAVLVDAWHVLFIAHQKEEA